MTRLSACPKDQVNPLELAGQEPLSNEQELEKRFTDPKASLALIESLRWPEGYICSNCGQRGEPWRLSRNRLVCSGCRHQGSATAGTPLEKTRTSLLIWFRVAWALVNESERVSVRELSRRLRKPYRLIWRMTQTFQDAMGCASKRKLEGRVLVAVVPAITMETRRRPILIATEIQDEKQAGEVRLRKLEGDSGEDAALGAEEVIAPGTAVVLSNTAFNQSFSSHGYLVLREGDTNPSIEGRGYGRIAHLQSRLSRRVRDEFIQSYLDEVGYRFNLRATKTPSQRFRTILRELISQNCIGSGESG